MIAYQNKGWRLCPTLIKFTDHGEAREEYVLDTTWHEEFAAKWDHLVITETVDVVHTEEQTKRFGDIQNMPEDFKEVYAIYVENGSVTDVQLPTEHSFNTIIARVNSSLNQLALTDIEIELLTAQAALSEQGKLLVDTQLALTDQEINLMVAEATLTEQGELLTETQLALTDQEISSMVTEAALLEQGELLTQTQLALTDQEISNFEMALRLEAIEKNLTGGE